MSEVTRDVTAEYRKAEAAAESFDPGEMPNISYWLRSAYVHGYAHALIKSDVFAVAKELAEALDKCHWELNELENTNSQRAAMNDAEKALTKYRELG